MENLIKIDTVDQYNKMFGLETLHVSEEEKGIFVDCLRKI